MEYTWTMDERRETRSRNAQGRGGDFIGGIDNEALDFSQLEAFINNDGSQGNGTYFGDSLNSTPPTGKLLNVIVENKRPPGHSLPESPPDSSSEHPYSPQENCEPSLNNTDTIYTTLSQPLYKPTNLLNLPDNLILGSHIVVAEQSSDNPLLENGNILHDRILVSDDLRSTSNLLNSRLLPENLQPDSNLIHERLLLPDGTISESNRPILIQTSNDSNPTYIENCQRTNSNLVRRNGNDILLVNKSEDYEKPQLLHLGFNTNVEMSIPSMKSNIEGSICDNSMENIQAVYTNLQNAPKKRKLSQDVPLVKSEPEHCSPSQLSPPGNLSTSIDDEYAASESCLSESQYQCIRFQPFQQTAWHSLCDQNLTELPVPHYRVDADKGFNFSNADDAFVCQKKNHFQITCHVQLVGDAQFVKTPEGFQKISSFHLHFYGVKHDCPTQTIRVEQSQSDRSKKPFHPVLVELVNSQVTKVTVGRLHFSETTSNNMRKKGKPNPEQRYFQLVVGLHAHTTHGNFPVISHASQKIIVRASNPGQFESDVELCWQKGQTQDSVFHAGKVGINTDRPDESLVVHGNLKITGHIIQPSDIRAKKNIIECDTAEQLRNVQRLRVVRYEYEPGFASQLNRSSEMFDTGVIAQEVAEVLPEAVSPAGDLILDNGVSIDNFLVVNKERIFMENIGAVKELCKVTDNLETRIDQLERINRRLTKLKRGDSLKSNSTVSSTKHVQRCPRHHKCHAAEPELCSNKFIQIVIVVLILIMAFCLVAITTLYLLEASSRSHSIQKHTPTSTKASHKSEPVTTPTKGQKIWTHQTIPHIQTNSPFKETGLKPTDSSMYMKQLNQPIGRPHLCMKTEDIENRNICKVYCCFNPHLDTAILDTPAEFPIDNERKQRQTYNRTKPFNPSKNKITSFPFPQSNNIDKQLRQKRDTDDWTDKDNSFDTKVPDEQQFSIMIQGKKFNTTLSPKYLSSKSGYNYTYYVPFSKYMPDDTISLIFRTTQANTKEIARCENDVKPYICYSDSLEDNKTLHRHKVNENTPSQQISSQSVVFEVDMIGVQTKQMTYRASLKQSLNTCKLSSTKLGLEFVEYNFHFFRICDDS